MKLFTDKEPHGVFFLIDNKSFYASCEAVERGFNPLKVPMVVISEARNTNGGLILATSPAAKSMYNIKANVSRKRDLPIDERLLIVPPRMNLYIKKNLQVNGIFAKFAAEEDILPYSIDESLVDMTHSWHLFGDSPKDVARLMQKTVRTELGLYTTVGIGDNPVQAKIALDIYAKHDADLIGELNYESVPDKIWKINHLTDVWGIGSRTEKRLNSLRIFNMYELAHANPYMLKQELGIIGSQLFATAWGVDRSNMKYKHVTKSASIGNSQVLPRDYNQKIEIETVIKEIGEQVAARLRSHNKLATHLSLSIGFSFSEATGNEKNGFSHTIVIEPTNEDSVITIQLLFLFEKNWVNQSVRNIAVYGSGLVENQGQQLNIFDTPTRQIQDAKLNGVVDDIHKKFGFTKLVYATSLKEGGTAIDRAKLVGGHSGGNSYE